MNKDIICFNLNHTCSNYKNGKCLMVGAECVFQGKRKDTKHEHN